MHNWSELRTAYYVAKYGTVSEAAEKLGVHRATVKRHIGALESKIEKKLFIRHTKGYVPTEFGLELLTTAEKIDLEVDQFIGKSKTSSHEMTGEIVIVAPPPALTRADIAIAEHLREPHPQTIVRFNLSPKIPKLELGEAHIHFHLGAKPETPDYVVRPFLKYQSKLYGHRRYFDKYGNPQTDTDLSNHKFAVVTPDLYSPHCSWIRERVPSSQLLISTNEPLVVFRAVVDGAAIGALPVHLARHNADLVEIDIPNPAYEVMSWVITHVDVHRSPKVLAVYAAMRELGLLGSRAIDVEQVELLHT